jgi:hypothetical protein
MKNELFDQESRVLATYSKPIFVGTLMVMLPLAIAAGLLVWNCVTRPGMTPLQRLYLSEFRHSALSPGRFINSQSASSYLLLMRDEVVSKSRETTTYLCVDEDVFPKLSPEGGLVRGADGNPIFFIRVDHKQKTFRWDRKNLSDKWMNDWFARRIYGVESFWEIFFPSVGTGVGTFFFGLLSVNFGVRSVMRRRIRRRLAGKHLRGTRLLRPREYARQFAMADGVGVMARDPRPDDRALPVILAERVWNRFTDQDDQVRIAIEKSRESLGKLLLGDPGTGKSQVIHRDIAFVRGRPLAPAGICYDPAGEFVAAHFQLGDIVLNPLDERCPAWSPINELRDGSFAEDLDLVAESFFPIPETGNENTRFFIRAAKSIFKLMLAERPSLETLLSWIGDAEAINQLVAGTEFAHLIDARAGAQRGAVLATLSQVGESLRLLSSPTGNEEPFSLTQWAERREGWIFLTATHDVREAIRPLHAAFFNIFMARLLSVAPEFGQSRPCWFIMDEFHSLRFLPRMTTFRAEARKYGIASVLGTQNRMQVREHYGEGAEAMLSAPALKIFFRTNEAESARWMSDCIGEEERDVPRVTLSDPINSANGKRSLSFTNAVERRSVVSKEEIMNLPNLHGYWRDQDVVVPFKIDPVRWTTVAPAFVPRKSSPPPSKLLLSTSPAPETSAIPVTMVTVSQPSDPWIDDNGIDPRF